MLHSRRKCEKSEGAKERLKIIAFYEEFGEKATKQVFKEAEEVEKIIDLFQITIPSIMAVEGSSTCHHESGSLRVLVTE